MTDNLPFGDKPFTFTYRQEDHVNDPPSPIEELLANAPRRVLAENAQGEVLDFDFRIVHDNWNVYRAWEDARIAAGGEHAFFPKG